MAALASVTVNPWFTCALMLTLRLGLTGAAWLWIFHGAISGCRSRASRWLVAAALSWLLGTAITLLTRLVLAECGLAGGRTEYAVLAVWLLAGLVLGRGVRRTDSTATLLSALPGLVLLMALVVVVMHLPRCGEWLVGGWDPGIYVNQGVALTRAGTFRPAPLPVHAALNAEELRLFTRGFGRAYREIFPGVPIDLETRTVQHYFFRLTPALVSVLAEHGGLRAATRLNLVVGVLAAVVFLACLWVHGDSRWQALWATALLVAHPLWVYHLHVPVSEMLELFLLAGMGLVLPWRTRHGAANLVLAVLLLLAVVNRFSFLPFAALLLAGVAWMDAERPERGRVVRDILVFGAAVGVGAGFDLVMNRSALLRLWFVKRLLLVATGLFVAVAGVLIVKSDWARALARRVTRRNLGWLLALAVVGVVGLWIGRNTALVHPLGLRLVRHLPFLGLLPLALAGGGMVLATTAPSQWPRALGVWMLVLAGMSAAVLLYPGIVPIYPWATRRHLSSTVPLLAVFGGVLLAWLVRQAVRERRPLAALGLALVLAAFGVQILRPTHRAWNCTEYDGLSLRLADVAAQLAAEDVVVADHPWWGTPLMLIYGKEVLDGRNLWAGGDRGIAERGLAALERLRQRGWRVRFLTSTTEGLAVYPVDIPTSGPDWSSAPFALNEVVHGPRVAGFETRLKNCIFRLYTMTTR